MSLTLAFTISATSKNLSYVNTTFQQLFQCILITSMEKRRFFLQKVPVNVRVTPWHAWAGTEGRRSIALNSSQPDARRRWVKLTVVSRKTERFIITEIRPKPVDFSIHRHKFIEESSQQHAGRSRPIFRLAFSTSWKTHFTVFFTYLLYFIRYYGIITYFTVFLGWDLLADRPTPRWRTTLLSHSQPLIQYTAPLVT
jgi:hypothetical protein